MESTLMTSPPSREGPLPKWTPDGPSPFVESLRDVRQQQQAGAFREGLVQVGLRVRLKTDAVCGADHIDAGSASQGPVEPGLYRVFRLDNTSQGRRAVLVKLPPRSNMAANNLYAEHYVFVSIADVIRCFAADGAEVADA